MAAGIDVTLVVPAVWRDFGGETTLSEERFRIVELPVERAGDVNRHAYSDPRELRRLIDELKPDVLDVHEEPFSVAAQHWLAAVPPELPVVMYTAQNVDKRYPPPFFFYERRAHRRAAALYPCSRQAASVARGKGFAGLIDVIPLEFDPQVFYEGEQSLADNELTLALVGRLVPERVGRNCAIGRCRAAPSGNLTFNLESQAASADGQDLVATVPLRDHEIQHRTVRPTWTS
jgi:hypothetical protein